MRKNCIRGGIKYTDKRKVVLSNIQLISNSRGPAKLSCSQLALAFLSFPGCSALRKMHALCRLVDHAHTVGKFEGVSRSDKKKKKTLPRLHVSAFRTCTDTHLLLSIHHKVLETRKIKNKEIKNLQVPLLTWLSGFCNRGLCLYMKVHAVCELNLLH